jgi:UDP-glucose 4-epimerase
MKVLITGISGPLGRMVARKLLADGHEIFGIDRRPWPDAPNDVEMFRADIRKRPAEDVFRTRRPEAVVHMATVTHLTARRTEDRYRINLGGTQAVFDHCNSYGVEHCIFVGRHTFYGAAPDSPMYHTENEPPMAMTTFPELSDLVAADLYAGSALWRFPNLVTTVLRFVYRLGPTRSGTLASFLRGPRVPTVMGFDPLFQFMHEGDVVAAIAATLDQRVRGVFNVSGPQPVPLSLLVEVTGRQRIPVPEPVFNLALGRFGLPPLPRGALNHVKYPVVVDSSAFHEATQWTNQYDEVQCMEAFRWA